MKAVIYNGVGDISINERDKPVPKADDVIVKVAYAGICGTDIHAYTLSGDDVCIYPKNEFGHELVGMVYEVGENIKNIHVGMRVTINPCTRRPESCGMSAFEICDMTGAFSEYVYVQDAQLGNNIIPLPDSLPLSEAVLSEPLAVAIHGVLCGDVKVDDKVLVYGSGTIGLCTIAALQKFGVRDIIVSDVNEFKLAAAQKLGAKTVNPKEKNVVKFLKEEWGSTLNNQSQEAWNADLVIDCAGLPNLFEEFINNSKFGSRYVQVAVDNKPANINREKLFANELQIKGSFAYSSEDIKIAVETLNDKNCNLKEIITHTYDHEEFLEAFKEAMNPLEAIKVTIKY